MIGLVGGQITNDQIVQARLVSVIEYEFDVCAFEQFHVADARPCGQSVPFERIVVHFAYLAAFVDLNGLFGLENDMIYARTIVALGDDVAIFAQKVRLTTALARVLVALVRVGEALGTIARQTALFDLTQAVVARFAFVALVAVDVLLANVTLARHFVAA